MALLYRFAGGALAVATARKGDKVHPSWVHGTCCLPAIPMDGLYLRTCKMMTLQFVVMKPALSFITIGLQNLRLYDEGVYRWNRGYAYVYFLYKCVIWLHLEVVSRFFTFPRSATYTVALYGLVLFYVAAFGLLRPWKPILKVITVKAVVFLVFWQSIAASTAVSAGVLRGGKEVRELQNFLICVESASVVCVFFLQVLLLFICFFRIASRVPRAVFIVSLVMIFAFPYWEYTAGGAPPLSFSRAVWHALSLSDVFADAHAAVSSTYFEYRERDQSLGDAEQLRAQAAARLLAARDAARNKPRGVSMRLPGGDIEAGGSAQRSPATPARAAAEQELHLLPDPAQRAAAEHASAASEVRGGEGRGMPMTSPPLLPAKPTRHHRAHAPGARAEAGVPHTPPPPPPPLPPPPPPHPVEEPPLVELLPTPAPLPPVVQPPVPQPQPTPPPPQMPSHVIDDFPFFDVEGVGSTAAPAAQPKQQATRGAALMQQAAPGGIDFGDFPTF